MACQILISRETFEDIIIILDVAVNAIDGMCGWRSGWMMEIS